MAHVSCIAWFYCIWLIMLVFASLLTVVSVFSIQMYPQSASGKNILQKLNNVFTTLFAIECTLKVVAVGIRVSR